MWPHGLKLFCALLALLCFSCSSLEVVPSPVISIEEEPPPVNISDTEHLLKLIAELRQELENLKLIFSLLKSNSQELSELSENFEQRLTKLQEQLIAARLESTELQSDLTKLNKQFEDYRSEVNRNKIRDGLIIGGIALVVGVIGGIFIGTKITKVPGTFSSATK